MKLDKNQLERLTALIKMDKDTFYACELEMDLESRGSQMVALSNAGWIEETGNTKETWFRINEDTAKLGVVKEWKKTPKAKAKLPRIVELLTEIEELLKN